MKIQPDTTRLPVGRSLCGLALIFGAAAFGGCVKQDVSQPVSTSTAPAAPDQTMVTENDDYVYYPQYEVYYSARRHQYGYRDGSRWAWRPAPPRVGVDVLFSSPSVHLDFHDSPEHHHADVVRSYPRNWRQPDRGHDDKGDHKDDRKDGDRKH